MISEEQLCVKSLLIKMINVTPNGSFHGQSCSSAAVCIRGQQLTMPAGSGACRLIGELLSAGRTLGAPGACTGEDGMSQEEVENGRSTCSRERGHPRAGLPGPPRPGLLSAVLTDAAKTSYTLLCARPLLQGPPGGRPVCASKMLWTVMTTTAPQRPAHKRPCRAQNQEGGCLPPVLKEKRHLVGEPPTPALRVSSAPALSACNGATGAVTSIGYMIVLHGAPTAPRKPSAPSMRRMATVPSSWVFQL